MIPVVDMMSGTERAVMVVMMPCVAASPVPIVCPAVVYVPPVRIVAPIPGRGPCVPAGAPEPIVDNGTIDIYGLDDVVRSVNVLVTYYLNGHIIAFVFLYVDRRYVLVDIFG